MAVAQWSSSVGCAGIPSFVGLVVVVAGQSVASPQRLSYSVESGRVLGTSHGVAVPPPLSGADPHLRWSGVGSQGCHRADLVSLLRGEAGWRMAAPSRWRCMVLASSLHGGPHGGGDGEPWADGVAHRRGGGFIMVSTVAHLRDLLDSVAVCSSAGSSFSWRLTPAPKL
jgi:hypothetical protein